MIQTNFKLNAIQNLSTTSINFKATNPEIEPKNESSKMKKVALTGLTAAGVISLALLAIKKGKMSQISQEINLETFKKAGNNFKNGVAFTKLGKPFSGTIIVDSKIKPGTKHYLKYENGILKASERKGLVLDVGYVTNQIKEYIYDSAGNIKTIIKKSENDILKPNIFKNIENIDLAAKRNLAMYK